MSIIPHRSLPEVHESVHVAHEASFLRRLFTFSGPAFMVSVGYMDPGNWATDLAAGAKFGYSLIWVILLSNLMAILLQTLSARLGIVHGRDLAQACREHYPKPIAFVLWILCEIAIAACDLAEVLGSAIGLHLLFGVSILAGVVITAFDVMILLLLQAYGIRRMEAFILTLVATIGACFAVEMFLSKPPLGEIVTGFKPSVLSDDALYIAIGIIGATVMPHNLYLHSALVQSRKVDRSPGGLAQANRFNLIDSVVALNGAFFVNAAILILAAAAFFRSGHQNVATLEEAHSLLEPILGSKIAPIAFALALLAAGQSSTITGTLAGQIVMEGFIHVRLRPWLRRLITRLIAIIPAVLVILWKGDAGVDPLLILSQVILSLQLSFAVVPLIHFASDKSKMGAFALPVWARILAWIVAAIIISLNVKLVYETVRDGVNQDNWIIEYILLPVSVVLMPLLAWMVFEPLIPRSRREKPTRGPDELLLSSESAAATLPGTYRRIGVALEAGPNDTAIMEQVLPLARASGADLVLIHVVESAAARYLGQSAADQESLADARYLLNAAQAVRASGVACTTRLGAGEAEHEIARIAEEEKLDLIVTGSHGHRLLGDLLRGSTASELRHLTRIPVMSVRVK